jgi:hypothetical protein
VIRSRLFATGKESLGMDNILHKTINAFNRRDFSEAVRQSAEGLTFARGRDEAFWMGLLDACEGYEHLVGGRMMKAEAKLIASMQKLRNFGFRYNDFEVTAALAGIRLAVEEIRAVKQEKKKIFDVSLLPQLRLAAKADIH